MLRPPDLDSDRGQLRQTRVGSVDVGKRADLVLLDANPLDDIGNVGRIHAVILGGRLLDRQQLDATLAAVPTQFQSSTVNQRPQ